MELEIQFDTNDISRFFRTKNDYSLIVDPESDLEEAAVLLYHDRVVGKAFNSRIHLNNSSQPVAIISSYIEPFKRGPQQLAFEQPRSVTFLKFRRDALSTRGYGYIGHEAATWPEIRGDELSFRLFQQYQSWVFRFQAERRPEPQASVGFQIELASDAHNLVTVLHTLGSERERFARYESYVQRLLPEVGEILSVPTGTPGMVQTKVAMLEAKGRRDLAYNLTQTGTGAVQILALVYAITMSKTRRLILFDEPTAYLHPGAARELMKLVTEFPQHQYVIATHMPLALDALIAPQIVLLERTSEGTAKSQSIDHSVAADQRLLLRTLGSSLQDVFGADHVVWVEGPTETEVYRLAMQITPDLPRGVVVIPIVNTGDLERRERTTLVQIYERLSSYGGLIPSNISFILDLEARKDQDIKELRRRTSYRVFFTEGIRMTENIFLDSGLIATFLNEACSEWLGDSTIAGQDIEDHWNGLKDAIRFGVDFERTTDLGRWRELVRGDHVLEDTVIKFSDAKLAYRKVEHGRRLAELCLQSEWASLLRPVLRTLAAALGLVRPL